MIDCYYIRGGIDIQEEKIYYNQKNIIDEIHKDTGCSIYEISKVLNSLGNVVKDKFSDSDDYVDGQMYEKMLSVAEEYSCDVVMCDCVKEFSERIFCCTLQYVRIFF